MKRCLGLLLTSVLFLAGAANSPDSAPLTYYVQLIRGGDGAVSPVAGGHRVGPKLAEKFHMVFKWNSYWEIASRKVEVRPGQKARVRLNTEREVEIDLSQPEHRRVAAFHKGTMVERTICPRSDAMTLIGSARDHASSWFVVVRRDAPGS